MLCRGVYPDLAGLLAMAIKAKLKEKRQKEKIKAKYPITNSPRERIRFYLLPFYFFLCFLRDPVFPHQFIKITSIDPRLSGGFSDIPLILLDELEQVFLFKPVKNLLLGRF